MSARRRDTALHKISRAAYSALTWADDDEGSTERMRSHPMKKLAKITMAAGAAALLSVGAFTVPTAAQAQPVVNVQFGPPPPPRVERVPPPRRGYVWAPGHWEWRRGGHVWVGGTWVKARPGYAYRAPEWRERDGRWEYNRGRWDRDRDGVPNRYDRNPNNPYRN
jgi:hypothetical protein